MGYVKNGWPEQAGKSGHYAWPICKTFVKPFFVYAGIQAAIDCFTLSGRISKS